ncbi:DUF5713 family protein [Isobaculum melis]|uniref:Uncharacterized protein n=1 Tax=Isobaculum melis TaxID=142588 RepID=A0A1H9T8K0_9LACT|nr:DUF5713 family protein [Isobaculum melis]SER93590.1 hypothetical protein SAMN04488559_11162 [Isobaculum melis]
MMLFFPNFLVDKIKDLLASLVTYLEEDNHSNEEIQSKLDKVVIAINDLQEEFGENDSEIETVARDSIGTTVHQILEAYQIDIDIEEAIRERDW